MNSINIPTYSLNKLVILVGFFLFAFGSCTSSYEKNQKEKDTPSILLRSSWQTINIGDIAHTPGVLALMEKYLPNVEVRLWASDVGGGVKEMLEKRFPNLQIMLSSDSVKLKKAFTECDFLLHGSGPYLVVDKDVERWIKETGNPLGFMALPYRKISVARISFRY